MGLWETSKASDGDGHGLCTLKSRSLNALPSPEMGWKPSFDRTTTRESAETSTSSLGEFYPEGYMTTVASSGVKYLATMLDKLRKGILEFKTSPGAGSQLLQKVVS